MSQGNTHIINNDIYIFVIDLQMPASYKECTKAFSRTDNTADSNALFALVDSYINNNYNPSPSFVGEWILVTTENKRPRPSPNNDQVCEQFFNTCCKSTKFCDLILLIWQSLEIHEIEKHK